MPRRARITDSYSSDEENRAISDVDNTPRATTKRKKPGLSPANGDASFTDERVPLKDVHLNDDAAEKKQRRRSTKFLAPMRDIDDEMVTATPRARPGAHVNAVEQTPAVKVPLDVMNTNFEEWMKMATDNKINVANAWNFALIDYFHDMSLLRNNGDNSINFQKASCTLDGCVKIWTSRVDSVGTETGKLLSNLANEGSRGDADQQSRGSDNEDGPNGHSNEKRKKSRSTEATLAKSYAQLKVKKLDLEFTVDPLFKKTCADFDEGGAGGLLMNHLALGMGHKGSMRVVFDAGDVAGADGGPEEEDLKEEEEDLIDLSSLQSFIPSLSSLSQMHISPSLIDFSFNREVSSFDDLTFIEPSIPNISADDDDDDLMWDDNTVKDALPNDSAYPEPLEQDFFTGDHAIADNFGGEEYDPVDMEMEGVIPDGSSAPDDMADAGSGMFPTQPFDPRRAPNEKELIVAMAGDEDGGMLDYFDQSFVKNWAGPEHWKLRKVVRRDITPNPQQKPKTKAEKKEAFRIDFLAPADESLKDVNKKLFAPSTRGAGITLPRSSSKKKGNKDKEEQTLPDDMHFSSRQLVTLFLKPKFTLRTRGQKTAIQERTDGEIDERFWAQAAADQAAGLQTTDDADETVGGGVIPFSTQFFHEDYDDGGQTFDEMMFGAEGSIPTPEAQQVGEEDLLAATQGIGRKVRPELVNYAKRAKRVDVRKLKENIWRELNIVTGHETETEVDEMMADDRPPTDPTEARDFTTVITGLRSTYPKEKMEEISTSFCFICLLHLANEQGLQINDVSKKSIDDDAGSDTEDQKVGDIWSLKIYRNPNATPAA